MSNVGATPIELGGIELRDNAGQIALPHLVLPAGRSIVVAGSAAEIGDALAERVATGLFNGLGNSGDRLSLVAGDGQILDAISYGTDATFNAPPLSAPGPGHSLQRRFAADGTLLGIELAADPSPGRIEAPASGQTEALSGAASSAAGAAPPSANELRDGTPTPLDAPPPQHLDDGGSTNRAAWIVLVALALGALGGVATFRVRELLRAA